MAQQQPPQERGINVGIGTGETQAIVIQLGRIADLLQQLVNEYKASNANPVRPQPFGGQ